MVAVESVGVGGVGVVKGVLACGTDLVVAACMDVGGGVVADA